MIVINNIVIISEPETIQGQIYLHSIYMIIKGGNHLLMNYLKEYLVKHDGTLSSVMSGDAEVRKMIQVLKVQMQYISYMTKMFQKIKKLYMLVLSVIIVLLKMKYGG